MKTASRTKLHTLTTGYCILINYPLDFLNSLFLSKDNERRLIRHLMQGKLITKNLKQKLTEERLLSPEEP